MRYSKADAKVASKLLRDLSDQLKKLQRGADRRRSRVRDQYRAILVRYVKQQTGKLNDKWVSELLNGALAPRPWLYQVGSCSSVSLPDPGRPSPLKPTVAGGTGTRSSSTTRRSLRGSGSRRCGRSVSRGPSGYRGRFNFAAPRAPKKNPKSRGLSSAPLPQEPGPNEVAHSTLKTCAEILVSPFERSAYGHSSLRQSDRSSIEDRTRLMFSTGVTQQIGRSPSHPRRTRRRTGPSIGRKAAGLIFARPRRGLWSTTVRRPQDRCGGLATRDAVRTAE